MTDQPLPRVLITGVRGKTGSELARNLRDRPGTEVLGGTTAPERVTLAGVAPVRFDWHEPATWPAALDGADAVYLVRPDIEDAPERIAALLADAPADARMVLIPSRRRGARPRLVGRAGRARRDRTGAALDAAAALVVHAGLHRRALLPRRDPHRRSDLTAGRRGPVSWIDDATSPRSPSTPCSTLPDSGRAYDLTGPRAIDLPTTAALLSAAAGGPVEHDDDSVADATAGLEGWYARMVADVYERGARAPSRR